jgi:hypothetical protein
MMLALGYYYGMEEIKIVERWQKRYGNKILFGKNIQDKVIVFVSYLVVNKIKKNIKKSISPLIGIVVKLIYFKK